jgi:glycosidase
MCRRVEVSLFGMMAVAVAVALPTVTSAQDSKAHAVVSGPTMPAEARAPAEATSWASAYDEALGARLKEREADWRNGAVVYQVIVDRFAPSANLALKRKLYPPPKVLHVWPDLPTKGEELPGEGLWAHELDFWGGDLASLLGKLGYVVDLGADVLYLNPIHAAYTNHKYDAYDYAKVSPEYGTRQDLIALAQACHRHGIGLMLDGVFNHMGRKENHRFQDALRDPNSPNRSWFIIDDKFKHGYRAWADVANLPEVNLENPAVRDYLWGGRDSVVQGYLRDGVDGWRLDAAYDIGFKYLGELTRAAHSAKRGSWVVGEIWCYPEEWSPSVDGVMNFHLRQIVLDLVAGKVSGRLAGRSVERVIADTGLDASLKSWFQLDNHDTERLKTLIPDNELRRLAQVLQFTLPGSPVVYYGTELGMSGEGDPANRAPMRWDLANDKNADLAWVKQLVQLRKGNRALRIGDFRLLDTETLFAFSRRADRVGECVIVAANPGAVPVREVLSTRESKLMSGSQLRDQLNPGVTAVVLAGRLEVEVPARTVRVFKSAPPDARKEYSPFKRVQ